ncbi:MAG: sulfite exporter TauE/SafE family protein [Parachlamydiales bacterium]|nr:sulfite exporter TauE/SafE family protein [Parachlamydiales bacterium]
MLGIGGCVITVPFLYYLFHYYGPYQNKIMQIAVCTSLAAAIITSAVSTYIQIRRKAIQGMIIKWMMPALLIGCVGGAILAHHTASSVLRTIFGFMAVLMGSYFFFPRLPQLHIASSPNPTISIFALGIGVLSSLLGLGGGSIIFPILLGYHVPIKNASATSSAATFISTVIGTISFLFISWGIVANPRAVGYIDIPSWILISIGSILTAPLGVKWSHTLDVHLIKRIFGACLFLIGAAMLFL